MVLWELNLIQARNSNLTQLQFLVLVKFQLEMKEVVVMIDLIKINQWTKL